MRPPETTLVAALVIFCWLAFATVWLFRKAKFNALVSVAWRGESIFVRIAAIAAMVAVSVYGGGKPTDSGGAVPMSIPHPTSGMNAALESFVLLSQKGNMAMRKLGLRGFRLDGRIEPVQGAHRSVLSKFGHNGEMK